MSFIRFVLGGLGKLMGICLPLSIACVFCAFSLVEVVNYGKVMWFSHLLTLLIGAVLSLIVASILALILLIFFVKIVPRDEAIVETFE